MTTRRDGLRRNMRCCVCDGEAGRFQQWHNRDKGFSICSKCAAKEATRLSYPDFSEAYGYTGIHFQRPDDPYWNETETFKTGISK